MLLWYDHLLHAHRIIHPQSNFNRCSPYLVMNNLSPHHIVFKNHPPRPYCLHRGLVSVENMFLGIYSVHSPHVILWLHCALLCYRASPILLPSSVFPILVMRSSVTSTLDRSPYPELSLNFFLSFLFIVICPTFII